MSKSFAESAVVCERRDILKKCTKCNILATLQCALLRRFVPPVLPHRASLRCFARTQQSKETDRCLLEPIDNESTSDSTY